MTGPRTRMNRVYVRCFTTVTPINQCPRCRRTRSRWQHDARRWGQTRFSPTNVRAIRRSSNGSINRNVRCPRRWRRNTHHDNASTDSINMMARRRRHPRYRNRIVNSIARTMTSSNTPKRLLVRYLPPYYNFSPGFVPIRHFYDEGTTSFNLQSQIGVPFLLPPAHGVPYRITGSTGFRAYSPAATLAQSGAQ